LSSSTDEVEAGGLALLLDVALFTVKTVYAVEG
jgi:hypothetical protein